MRPDLFAFAGACAFFGAALYVNIVEQPARLTLEAHSIIREWKPSNRRNFLMFAMLSIISALTSYVEYVRTGDMRWLLGGTIILASWPYADFVMIPLNNLLYGVHRNAPASMIRELVRDWACLNGAKRRSILALPSCSLGILASPA